MRETRLSGSEGGGARTRSPYPYPTELRSQTTAMVGQASPPAGSSGFQPRVGVRAVKYKFG